MENNGPSIQLMTASQWKSFRRIQREIAEHFSHGLVSVVYKGNDNKLHIQVANKTANSKQAIDLARRTLQETEVQATGIIKTLFE